MWEFQHRRKSARLVRNSRLLHRDRGGPDTPVSPKVQTQQIRLTELSCRWKMSTELESRANDDYEALDSKANSRM